VNSELSTVTLINLDRIPKTNIDVFAERCVHGSVYGLVHVMCVYIEMCINVHMSYISVTRTRTLVYLVVLSAETQQNQGACRLACATRCLSQLSLHRDCWEQPFLPASHRGK